MTLLLGAFLVIALATPCAPFMSQLVPLRDGHMHVGGLCRSGANVMAVRQKMSVKGISCVQEHSQQSDELNEVEEKIGVKFKDRSLLRTALVHRSYVDNNMGSNERLEFLGDAVLGMVIAENLFRAMPDTREGVLTGIRKEVVRKEALAKVARERDLGQYLYMSSSEVNTGGRNKANALADVTESIIAAVYLDQGLDAARTLIHNLFQGILQDAVKKPEGTDYKTRLQEEMSRLRLGQPVYSCIQTGPGHKQTFTSTIATPLDVRIAWGSGRSKKSAEQDAAQYALTVIGKMAETQIQSLRHGVLLTEDMADFFSDAFEHGTRNSRPEE